MPTSTDLLQQLHSAQQAEYEAEEERLAQRKRQTPDAQWHLPLGMPERDFDVSPEVQQAFANDYRAEHDDADRIDEHGQTNLSKALFAWRRHEASRRWAEVADRTVAAPAC